VPLAALQFGVVALGFLFRDRIAAICLKYFIVQ